MRFPEVSNEVIVVIMFLLMCCLFVYILKACEIIPYSRSSPTYGFGKLVRIQGHE